MTIEQAFGNAVRRLRKERNLSQEALALSSKLDRTFISLIECGKKNPTLITIFQLASGLHIPTEKILREVEAITLLNGVQSMGEGLITAAEPQRKAYEDQTFADLIRKYNLVHDETILLVEDEEVTRDFLVMLLQRVGYQVIVAGNGQDAIDLYGARQAEICLVVMDVVIPTCNGLEAATRIREKYPESKVLLISGYDPECLNLQAGKFPFIKKPLDPLPFINQVRTLLED